MDELSTTTENNNGSVENRIQNGHNDSVCNSRPFKQGMKTELDRPVLQQKHFKEFYQRQANPPAERKCAQRLLTKSFNTCPIPPILKGKIKQQENIACYRYY